ncbi:universal stress protein [Aquibacillus sediminis]|uniref:universal stress protein n=1 Tax=Aquibacillus sediminis TaxID=2574734 RepID=UPI0011095DF6|nr:universal stress protein [Aquibacillus sediminis]
MRDVLLVAIDGSDPSFHAIDYAVKLAEAANFSLGLLHVQPKVNTYYANKKVGKKKLHEYKKERAIKILEQGKQRIDKEVPVTVRWRLGITSQEICDEAKTIQAVGIVMGTKNMKTIKGKMLGSTCLKVIQFAPCPVTVVS